MSAQTTIEWTDRTWNPTRGCSRVSPGCENCYAERVAARFTKRGLAYHGLAKIGKNGPRWTGEVVLVKDALHEPLSWKKPCRVFVNSMSDLFHEKLTNEQIAAVFGVMAACPQHTFQILTKRSVRMREWFEWVAVRANDGRAMFPHDDDGWHVRQLLYVSAKRADAEVPSHHGGPWPLPNVWLGVSVEDQQRADERIRDLVAVPASVHFLSCEPLLGPLEDLTTTIGTAMLDEDVLGKKLHGVDWIIIGGESGPGAREMKVEWAWSIIEQCRAAKVAVFLKQMGSKPTTDHRTRPDGEDWIWTTMCRSGKGGDMSEWPARYRIREFPEVST